MACAFGGRQKQRAQPGKAVGVDETGRDQLTQCIFQFDRQQACIGEQFIEEQRGKHALGARRHFGLPIRAGSLVAPGKVLESGMLYIGRPAVAVRALSAEQRAYLHYSAEHYVRVKDNHLGGAGTAGQK